MLLPSFESVNRIAVQVGRTVLCWNTLKFTNLSTSLLFKVAFCKYHLVTVVKNHLVLFSLPEEFKAYVV